MEKKAENKESENPYLELGNIFIAWREEKYRSALLLSQSAKFSFGYNRYNSFEKGTHLPSIEQILEIATFFEQDPLDAAIIWARVQMPTEYLRKHFQSRRFQQREARKLSGTEQPAMENTWLMSPGDLAILKKYPWLSDFNIQLTKAYPKEVPFRNLNLQGLKPEQFVKKYIRLWLENGYVKQTKSGFRLERPHIVIPDTEAGEEVIRNNMQRASEYIIKFLTKKEIDEGKGYRFFNTRNLSPGQVRRWIAELDRISEIFEQDKYEVGEGETLDDMYVMMLGLAPRNPGRK